MRKHQLIARVVAVALAAGMRCATPGVLAAEQKDAAEPKNPFSGRAEIAEEGRGLLNQYCSHCHGPDAIQPERVRDLRRLKRRYGDEALTTFYTTVNNGRMDKGMPIWKGVLPDDILWRIYTYLETVQVAK